MSEGGYEEKASPAKAGGKASGSKQPKPKPNPIRARIIGVKVQNAQTHLLIAAGYEQGVEHGMRATMIGDGLANPKIDMVYNVRGVSCEAMTPEPIGHIRPRNESGERKEKEEGEKERPARYVEIGPDKAPDR